MAGRRGNMMIFFWNRAEIYFGYSLQEQARIRLQLANEHIPFRVKVVDQAAQTMGRGTTRGNFGSAFVNDEFTKQYYIYVNKADIEKARLAIGPHQ
jgi:hypothetical protein